MRGARRERVARRAPAPLAPPTSEWWQEPSAVHVRPERLPAAMPSSSFTYTLIPCDPAEPLKELTLAVPPTLEENIGCLTSALNDHYRRVAPFKGEADKQAVMKF